jgi:hypothetical protein
MKKKKKKKKPPFQGFRLRVFKGLGVTNNFKLRFYKGEQRSFLNFKRVMNGGKKL